jgi:sulfate adenylyltransferase
VAAEISRHGGVAVCSPIAPFDETRQDVRAMTEAAGGAFFLVHVATPLEECERRDRKGLYAKARRGEIPDFTGISSPYEVPEDADLRIDTTGRSIDDCRDEVLEALAAGGFVADRRDAPAEGAPAEQAGTDDPIRVLFVCTANICRSPYLELRARQLLGPDSGVEVSSAGTHGFDSSPVSDTMTAEFTRRGTEVDGFRSRAATGEMVDAADLVLTAEANHRTRLLEDRPAAFRKIFTLGQFVASTRAADPSLRGRELLAALQSRRVPPSPDHDIDDPYRRGPEAARQAAVTMEALLEVVVDRLRRLPPTDQPT